MRAAVLRAVGEPLEIEQVELDRPKEREIVVLTRASGLCHSDLSVMNGTIGIPAQLPIVLGHEVAGVVTEVGSAVAYVQPGDRVVSCASQFCGLCEHCLSGRAYLCERTGILRTPADRPRITGSGQPVAQYASIGGFAEQVLVHENAVVKIDDDIPFDVASIVGCSITTGLGAVISTARVHPGATCAVIGCGGVGLAAIQGCYISGARRIVAVDVFADRLAKAAELGATHVVDASEGDPVATVAEIAGGGGVDFAFEVVGHAGTVAQAFAMTRRGGTAVVVGVVAGQEIRIPGLGFLGVRTLRGCTMGSNRFRIDIPRWLDFYRQGRLSLDDLVTARIGLDEVNAGYEAMERGEGARSVVIFS